MFPFEDHRGALWLAGCEAGSEGLFYFDGSRFIEPVKEHFPKAIVRGLAEDSEGGIWIASSRGIYRFLHGQLQMEFDGAALAGITQIAPDVFLATAAKSSNDPLRQAALVRISRTRGEWNFDVLAEPVQQLQYRLDRTGHVLYGCEEGYCEVAAADIVHWTTGHPLAVTRHKAENGSVYAQGVSVVWRDRLGCIWRRERVSASYQCPADPKPINLPVTLANLGFPSIFELADGTIGFPSYGKLTLGRPGNLRVLNGSNGCPNVVVVLPGKDDSLWISSTSGLYVLPFRNKMEFWSARDGLRGTVWNVLHSGKDVFASADTFSQILDGDRSHWRLLDAPGGRVFPGPANTIMLASSNAVFQINSMGQVLRHSPPLKIWLLARDKSGGEWAGGKGVYKLGTNGRDITALPRAPAQESVQGIEFDRDGDLWTCSWSGLSRMTQSGWSTISTKEGLLQNGCGAMTVDRQGDIWYAYETIPGFALIHHPRSTQPAIQQFQNEGANNRTYFFGSDPRGWLWRGTPDGLYVADLDQARQGQWLHLSRADGLPAVDTNQNSFSLDSDGSVWFGAENSVIHLFPSGDLLHPSYAPAIFVSAFSQDGSPAKMADLVAEFKRGADVIAHIGSLQFDRRNALRLRYRLLPDQSSWTVGRDLDIQLGRLRSGAHRLEVQAQLGPDGPWSATSAKSFTVLKPVWLTLPAIVGFALTGSIGIAGARRWRNRRKERAARTLPAIEEWRLAALCPEIGQLAGTVLDSRFEVGAVLARGGFATVAKGQDLEQRRPCAIKVFRQEVVDNDWMVRRFQQEILALEKIRHPNVVRILGHGTTPAGSPYLVMEFVEGETLREKLTKGGLSPTQTANYLRQTGDALEEIHAAGICHRDLKPENLMIRPDKPAGKELVLIDFSIAIVQDPDETLHGLSRAAGTLYYMAPEQSIGYADASTDIYSLAKVLVEMLTGQRLSTLLPDASMDLPERVRELLVGLDLGLSSTSLELISSALEFDPLRRPKSASRFANQIANDLGSVLKPA
jgi:tRNA A-37 threonylcarbamoyl transferase component Bud32/ligand-binding sensor domain-containing protein